MDWIHETKREWLEARKTCLTATEIADVCCSRNERSMIKKLEGYWISKESLEPVVTRSTGAAARGHILEPYAVEQFNHDQGDYEPTMFHWDDILIRNSKLKIGYSPDATTIKPTDDFPTVIEADGTGEDYRILEIKSYNAAHHWECHRGQVKKEEYQIAAAMVVDKCISYAELMFYNPELVDYCRFEMGYSRDELKDKIKKINKVVEMWLDICYKVPQNDTMKYLHGCSGLIYTIDDIIKAESSSLNVAKRAGII